MSARGWNSPDLELHSIRAPGMMRHGPFPGGQRSLESLSHSERLENKAAAQAAEIEHLAREKSKLISTHAVLRDDLLGAQQDVQKLKAHFRSIQTESDIQIRILMDKLKKMEADVRDAENIKNDLLQAHAEAQILVKARDELTMQMELVSQELKKSRDEMSSLPVILDELDSLTHEHERLRATFECEKDINTEQVEHLQAMEKNLIGMVREVENLHAEVANAENRAHAIPFGGGYVNSSNSPYPASVQPQGVNTGGHDVPAIPIIGGAAGGDAMISYGISNGHLAATSGLSSTGIVGTGGANTVWAGGPYDPSLAPR